MWSCCLDNPDSQSGDTSTGSGQQVTPAVAREVALRLIELVAPDVMYNGIPWPEEDFMKATVERSGIFQNI